MTVGLRTKFLWSTYSKIYCHIGSCDVLACYYTIAGKTEHDVLTGIASHRCPTRGPTRYNMSKSILERMWDDLDDLTAQLVDITAQEKGTLDPATNSQYIPPHEAQIIKGEARGIARCIAYMAVPYFTEVKAVSKEALRRHRMRIGEIPFEPTPGYNYNPQPAQDYAREPYSPAYAAAVDAARRARTNAETASPRTTRGKSSSKLTQQQIDAIRAGRQGGFTDQQLADLYKVPVMSVKAVD
jgi:hypothetical protein